ncbi:MAG: biopolymer transporter ExbD [Pirellulaceae bacterium]|nr:MAG: biopolymer transporter ExbD [Pirellulaceae bacterium]
MNVVFHCPYCGTEHSAARQLVGRRVRCPGCDRLVEVTAPQESAVATPPVTAVEVPMPSQRAASRAVRRARPTRPASASIKTVSDLPAVDFRQGRKRLVEAEMDMTPMVDVVFNLLIFFMVTAAFSLQKSLEIPKPEQTDQPSTQVVQIEDNPDYVVIIVDQYNTFQVTTPEWERECPSRQELLVQLRDAKRGSGGHVPTKVLVKAHPEATHERVVMALDSATAVGFEEIQLTTLEEEA